MLLVYWFIFFPLVLKFMIISLSELNLRKAMPHKITIADGDIAATVACLAKSKGLVITTLSSPTPEKDAEQLKGKYPWNISDDLKKIVTPNAKPYIEFEFRGTSLLQEFREVCMKKPRAA
jgi:hypothetical protein